MREQVEDYFREVEMLQDARPQSRGRTASPRASSAGRRSQQSRPSSRRTASNADVADLDDLDELERRVRALEVPRIWRVAAHYDARALVYYT